MKYTWIKEHSSQFPIEDMCNVLKVSSSGYYSFCSRKPSDVSLKSMQLESNILKIYKDNNKIYGYRKIYKDIAEENKIFCCQETVRRKMKKLGISAKISRRFVKTTDSNHSYNVADNLLNRDFEADRPNQKWVADITYIPTQQGWLYLAAVLDLFGRKLVGWAVSDKIDRKLVIAALNNAISNRRPGKGLMHHSDRGSQYA